MPVTLNSQERLDQYKAIANAQYSQVSIGSDGKAQSAEFSGVSCIKRFFNTKASKLLNKEAMADFKNVLTSNYGRLIADKVFQQSIGLSNMTKGKYLSSQMIGKALAQAEQLYQGTGLDTSLRHNFATVNSFVVKTPLTEGGKLEFDLDPRINAGYSEVEKGEIRDFATLSVMVSDLLAEYPTDSVGLQDFESRLNGVKQRLYGLCLWPQKDSIENMGDSDFRIGNPEQFENHPLGLEDDLNERSVNESNSSIRLDDGESNGDILIEEGAVDPETKARNFETLSNERTRLIELLDAKLFNASEICDNHPLTYRSLNTMCRDLANSLASSVHCAVKFKEAGRLCSPNVLFTLKVADNLLLKQGGLKMLNAYMSGDYSCVKGLSCTVDGETVSFSERTMRAMLDTVMPRLPETLTSQDGWQDSVCKDPEKRLTENPAKQIRGFIYTLADCIARQCGIGGSLENSPIADTIKKNMDRAYMMTMNSGEWNTISKDVTFICNGQNLSGTSTITPASQMQNEIGKSYKEQKDETGNVIRPQVNGVMCHCFGEKTHAVNLASSTFTINVPGRQSPVVAFTGIRHGVHAATELDGEEFKTANLNRATEAVKAAFLNDARLMKLINDPNYNPDKPIPFLLSSVSLLTPDPFRSEYNTDEARMLRGQTEAYKSLNCKELTVTINRKTVKIKPHILTFNYGVNEWAVGKISSRIAGWTQSQGMNLPSLKLLESITNSFLDINQEKLDQYTKNAIKTLLNQIKYLNASEKFSKDDGDNYKMASRIAVLTYLLGGTPCWNCKSGKDRTGLMDAECKALAGLIALKQPLPSLGKISDDHSHLIKELALNGGNHEIQKYNTGLAGFKLKNSFIPKRLNAGLDEHTLFRGGSDYIKS